MTREEKQKAIDAVERLNALKQFIGYDKDSEIVQATQESLDMAIKALEALERIENDIHNAIDNALMYGYGDNYINACENILQIIQKQVMCLKIDKTESEDNV